MATDRPWAALDAPCVICGRHDAPGGRTTAYLWRLGSINGVGLPPDDLEGVRLCYEHYREGKTLGRVEFERRIRDKINPTSVASAPQRMTRSEALAQEIE